MTPEERWTKIENALETVAEGQAQHTVEIAELRRLHKEHSEEMHAEMTDLRRIHTSLALAVNQIAKGQLDMQRNIADMQRNTQNQIDQLAQNIDRFLKGQESNGKRDR